MSKDAEWLLVSCFNSEHDKGLAKERTRRKLVVCVFDYVTTVMQFCPAHSAIFM